MYMAIEDGLTESKVAIFVSNTLTKVDVTALLVAVGIPQAGAENRNVTITFQSKMDVIC